MSLENTIQKEIMRRRTFAVVSHPDAGKTTITEKFLWYGKVIREAGHVKAKANKKFATSDWMEIERKRGISVTSSVLSFPYKGCHINLLDTPGHEDFCEDTYRALTAVDSALVLIDSAKGVEAQTIKLMEACKLRKSPVTVFINKMDRDGRDAIELMDEVESILGVQCVAKTLPIGNGEMFQGVYSMEDKTVHFYNPESGEDRIEQVEGIDDPELDNWFDSKYLAELRERHELVTGVMDPFSMESYLAGEQAPVYFGSALNNFGVQHILDSIVNIAPAPIARSTDEGDIDPKENEFSGIVFKIQANMDPKHRDRIAYLRVCSGKCSRGDKIYQCRTGRFLKLAAPTSFKAQEKEIIEEAFAGDIIGIHDPGYYNIGDTLTFKDKISYLGIPDFPAEHFVKVVLRDPLAGKKLQKGLEQLSEEGATQLFKPLKSASPVLGVVGKLQFDVIKFRLENEYNAICDFEPVVIDSASWVYGKREEIEKLARENAFEMAKDKKDRYVYLSPNSFRLSKIKENYSGLEFLSIPKI